MRSDKPVGKYQLNNIMLKSRTRLNKEDQETLVKIDGLYEELRNQAVQEGRKESDRTTLEDMLLVKFGTVDPLLEATIPGLLALNGIDRVRAVMQLSREELIRDFGI
jgi:hypothetical protein